MKVAGLLVIALTIHEATTVNRRPGMVEGEVSTARAVNAILESTGEGRPYSLIVIKQSGAQFGGVADLGLPLGAAMFEVAVEVDGKNANTTQVQLSRVVRHARRLREISRFVTAVVVSDDPSFLATFTEWSARERFIVVSIRLLVLTRLPLNSLKHLYNFLAMTNSMLLIVTHNPALRCTVYVQLPYSGEGVQPLKIAAWTPKLGITLTTRLALFPPKFELLANGPQINITFVERATVKKVVVDDPEAPGGKKIFSLDPERYLVEPIAKRMNFTLHIKNPPDQAWGIEMANGSYTGMMGMIQREEAECSLNLFHATHPRTRIVDFTFPVLTWFCRLILRRGNPEVDPWGFFFPLMPSVWGSILVGQLGVLIVLLGFPLLLPQNSMKKTERDFTMFNCFRVLLQEDIGSVSKWWWWERVMLGSWMLVMMLMSLSYTGNLMSLLAIKYIPMPVQSRRDVLSNPIAILVAKGTTHAHAFIDATEGINREVGDLAKIGRFNTIFFNQQEAYLASHVRKGTHSIISVFDNTAIMMAKDFSNTGSCDFYLAREEFNPMMASFAWKKDHPIYPGFNRRLMRLVEAGLYFYLLEQSTPNFTACLNPPKKVAVREPLGLINLWGTLVVYVGGAMISVLVFWLEVILSRLTG